MPGVLLLLNILRMNGQNLTKFCMHILIDKIYIGIVKHHVLKICNRVTALDLQSKDIIIRHFQNGRHFNENMHKV